MTCPDPIVAQKHVNKELTEAEDQQFKLHLSSCMRCRERVNEMKREVPTASGMPPLPPLQPMQRGSLLGRYLVLDVLGIGGMGEVYAAHDPKLDRKVAIKLMKAQDEQHLLLREAQAMAKLSHPNALSVFDVGLVNGRVFLAMELVTGSTVRQWLKDKPRSWREVVQVFIDAGRGLNAAHQAGMVHRDFKLENILVGTDGRVRVADFGLARATDAMSDNAIMNSDDDLLGSDGSGSESGNLLSLTFTSRAALPGTPGYIAPEQYSGSPASAVTDQFAFCVALYRALYLERPFAGDNAKAVARAAQEGQVRPAPAGTKVPTWLRRVVLRGLQPVPEDRFPSMDALLAALSDDPARVRRRWLMFAGGAAAVLLLGAAGLEVRRQQNEQCNGAQQKLAGVWDAERKQAVHAAFATTNLPYAEDSWRILERALDGYANAFVAQHTETCEATRVRGEQSDSVLNLRMQCLSERLDELRALSDVLVRADANMVESASTARSSLTVLSRCADVAALERRMPVPKNDEIKRRVEEVQKSLNALGAQAFAGTFQEQLPHIEKLVAEAKALDYPPLRAEANVWLVSVKGSLGRFEGLRELTFETLRLAEISGDDATRVRTMFFLAQLGNELGDSYEQVLAFIHIAEAILPRIKDHARLECRIAVMLGNTHLYHGKYDAALAAYERGLAIAESRPDLADQISLFVANIGSAYSAQAQYGKAAEQHLRSIEMLRTELGPNHPESASDFVNIGVVYTHLNELTKALAYLDDGLAIRVNVLGLNSVLTTEAQGARAEVLRRLGRLDEAEELARAALTTLDTEAPESVYVPEPLTALGRIHLDRGQLTDALSAFQRATKVDQKLGRPALMSRTRTGETLWRLGRIAEADKSLVETLAAIETAHDLHVLQDGRFVLARVRWDAGRKAEARTLAEQALAGTRTLEGDTKARIAELEAWLATHKAG